MITLLLVLLLSGPPVRVLVPGDCVQEATFALDRAGAEAVNLCFRERDRLREALAACPVQIEPPANEGLPWWSVPVSFGAGVIAGGVAGLLLVR